MSAKEFVTQSFSRSKSFKLPQDRTPEDLVTKWGVCESSDLTAWEGRLYDTREEAQAVADAMSAAAIADAEWVADAVKAGVEDVAS